jgi:hypothetical protein
MDPGNGPKGRTQWTEWTVEAAPDLGELVDDPERWSL